MPAAYWQSDYWANNYWHDDYWLGGPVPAPVVTVPVPVAASGPSKVQIVSAALQHLGLREIQAMDDKSPRAELARTQYQATVDELITEHKWKCSLASKILTRVTADPIWRWGHAFQLPTDPYCLKVWHTSLDHPERGWQGQWEVQGRTIVTRTQEDAISIEYGARILDANLFDPLFRAALEYKLAAKWAYPLTGKTSLAESMRKLYEVELARAKAGDSQSKSPRAPIRTTTYTRVR